LFSTIIREAQTHYPFGEPPVHLFPELLVQRASLMNGSNKRTIAVHAVFDGDLKLGDTWIEHCLVDCDTCDRFTYEQAAKKAEDLDLDLELGLAISRQLRQERSRVMSWLDHSGGNADITLTIPVKDIHTGEIVLRPDSDGVKSMKSMIAEFAILANSVFAKGLSDRNVFLRSAVLTSEIKNSSELTGQTLLYKIIEQSVSATYTAEMIPHDIVTGDVYTHATSPLRRASDCIVHVLLKSQLLGQPAPYSKETLQRWSVHLTNRAKNFKKEQFNAIKKATLTWMTENLPVKISVLVMSFTKPFVNMLIVDINSMPVNISYTLKRINSNFNGQKKISDITITKVKLTENKYDEGTLPELDVLF
jgi:exoribonuclease R